MHTIAKPLESIYGMNWSICADTVSLPQVTDLLPRDLKLACGLCSLSLVDGFMMTFTLVVCGIF